MLLALSGCSGQPAVPQVVVGHVADLSGPDKPAGVQAMRGISLAVRAANKGEGLHAAVIHADTRGQLDAGEAEAVRLVAVNRVAVLIGGVTAAEVERLDRARAVVIGLAGARTRSMSDFVFLTGLTPAARGRSLARQWTDSLPLAAALIGTDGLGTTLILASGRTAVASVAVLVDERQEANIQAAEAFAKELSAAGLPAPPLRRYAKDTDLDALLTHLRDEQPAAVLLAGEPDAVRRVRDKLPSLPILFAGREASLTTFQAHPQTQDGIYLVSAFVADADLPRARAFVKEYKSAFQEQPGPAAALAYESAALLFAAWPAGEARPDRAVLRERLRALQDFEGLCGPLTFGPDQVLRRPAFVVRLEKGQARTLRRGGP